MNKSWILHGPQGTGKTLHAPSIARLLDLPIIDDERDLRARSFRPFGVLHIADELPVWARDNRHVISIEAALERLAKAQA